MQIIEVKSLSLSGIKVIKYKRLTDNRGYFTETFRESDFVKVIPGFKIKQVNESNSKKKVVRGLHLQWNPYMGKLVRTIKGHMVDLFLDVRKGSPTYGKICGYDMLAKENEDFNEWIWIPPGFAHGNYYLEDSIIEYFCTGKYAPKTEAGILVTDPDLDWSLCERKIRDHFNRLLNQGAIISSKDKNNLTLKEWTKNPGSDNFIFGKI